MALPHRPSPEEVLDGVIRSLREQVLPHLHDPTAQEQAGSAVTLLTMLRQRWDGAVADLVEESEELSALLQDAGRAPPEPPRSLRHSVLAAHVDRLHEALLDLVLAAERAPAGSPLSALQPRLREALEAIHRRRA